MPWIMMESASSKQALLDVTVGPAVTPHVPQEGSLRSSVSAARNELAMDAQRTRRRKRKASAASAVSDEQATNAGHMDKKAKKKAKKLEAKNLLSSDDSNDDWMP